MKSICFVLPYFGNLPKNFELWLQGCKYNPTVNFIIYTDDHHKYDYPDNVKVKYISFEEIKKTIQSFYDFKIFIDSPWRLALFKPAYGEIFADDLNGYDFWGYCDADLMWGDIRAFITDNVLNKYERIGTKGHASIYKNDSVVNTRYRNIVSENANYKKIFSGEILYSFDEDGMDEIYDSLSIKYYFRPYFAHLEKYEPSFYLKRLPKNKLYTNKYQVFLWHSGKLDRIYIDGNELKSEEYMYIHFFCRPMKFFFGGYKCNDYIIYPDVMMPFHGSVSLSFVRKHGRQSKLSYNIKMIWFNRHKITIKKIMLNLKNLLKYKREK